MGIIFGKNNQNDNLHLGSPQIVWDKLAINMNITKTTDMSHNNLQNSMRHIVYRRIKHIPKIQELIVNIYNNNIYIYIVDHIKKKSSLIYVIPILNNNDCLKYIIVSEKLNMITFPENGDIIVYDLCELLDNHNLKYVIKLGIYIENTLTICDTPFPNIKIYSCDLYRDLYIIICYDHTIYTKIIIFNHTKRILHVLDLCIDIKSKLIFSRDGYELLICTNNDIYNKTTNVQSDAIYLYNFDDLNKKIYPIKIYEANKDDVIYNIYLSNDKKLLLLVKCNKIDIIDMTTKYIHTSVIDMKNIKNMKHKLIDYSACLNISPNNINGKLYVLFAWSNDIGKIYYWIIKYDKICKSFGSFYINTEKNVNLKNDHTFICDDGDNISIYNLGKVIPLIICEIISINMKYELDHLYETIYMRYANEYLTKIIIRGSNSSHRIYNLDHYTRFIGSLRNNNTIQIPEYCTDLNANINIYTNTKSFDIFQKLIVDISCHDNIIDNITRLKGLYGIQHMMADMMMHFYEYTKMIFLKNNDNNARSAFGNKKALYIGYILMTLILKYYIQLFKLCDEKYITSNENVIINLDVAKSFVENFPIFEEFIKYYMDNLMQ